MAIHEHASLDSLNLIVVIDVNSEDDVRMRKRRRGLLRMYYGVDDQVPEEKANPLDIDHNQFKSDMFMEKVLKECSLNELYQMEGKMKKGRRQLIN